MGIRSYSYLIRTCIVLLAIFAFECRHLANVPAVQEKTLSHGGGSQKVPYAYAAILCTPYPRCHFFPVHSAASEAKCPLGTNQPRELKRHALPLGMHLSMLFCPRPAYYFPQSHRFPKSDDAVGPRSKFDTCKSAETIHQHQFVGVAPRKHCIKVLAT